jgi:hypothetical protein
MSQVSRRAFAESLAVAALAPLIGSKPEAIRLPAWGETITGSAAPPKALARALAGVVRTQYGSRLSSRDLATITRLIQTGLERVDQLHKYDLANGDEPDFVFSAQRSSAT